MNHDELLDYGCEYATAEDRWGDTKSGYWLDGVYLGSTARIATEAIRG